MLGKNGEESSTDQQQGKLLIVHRLYNSIFYFHKAFINNLNLGDIKKNPVTQQVF